jgi:hypothetical protein
MYLWWMEYASNEEYRDFWFYAPPSATSSGLKPPPYMVKDFNFSYDFGFEFVWYLYQRDKWNSVNQVYQNLPVSSEQILHPEKYLAGERPVEVTNPSFAEALGEGWIQTTNDVLGEWTTYLLLGYGAEVSAQLDDDTAKEAARGWGGDHYEVYHNLTTNETVLASRWIWDSQNAASRFHEAFVSYQTRRYTAAEVSLGKGKCWEANQQTSCVLANGRETLWLLAPNQVLMVPLLALYPDFH